MNYGSIKKNDIANGEGVRTSLFVSGCRNRCENCFNPETWDFSYGKAFTAETEKQILDSLEPYYIAGLTILGGEPMEEENQKDLLPFLKDIKETYPNKSIWLYTGYSFDKDLLAGGRKYTEYTMGILELLDVLVDGRFMEELKDVTLRFRGSANQRLIDVKKTLMDVNNIVIYE